MSYAIANIVVGTIINGYEDLVKVKDAYARHCFFNDLPKFREIVMSFGRGLEEWNDWLAENEIESDEDIFQGILEGGDAFEWEEDTDLMQPWESLYSSSEGQNIGYVGVEIGSFDETENFPLESICNIRPRPDQKLEAMKKYGALPEEVRRVLPPVDVYVVWSSS